ncbi:MAG TPA: ATP-binding protein [Verrucomicrobiae bacterium]|nr:ATP-binding protein [Verrucomicrobiae bacterium]
MNAYPRHRIFKKCVMAKLLLAMVLLSSPRCSSAKLLFYDGFDYSEGTKLGEFSSSKTWENPKNQIIISGGNLEFAGLKTSEGNHINVALGSSSLDSVRTINGVWREQSNGTLYISFLLRLESVSGIAKSGDGTSLLTVTHTSNHSQLLGINLINDGAVRLGILKFPSDDSRASSSVFFGSGPGAALSADGSTTYLVVARYRWVEGATNDEVTLWVNPATLGINEDPTNKISASGGTDGAKSAGRLILSRGPNVSIDELRIGQSWADVTPVNRPSQQPFMMIGILVCGLVAAALWIAQLRRKVRERSAALRAQIEERQKAEQQRFVERERARIARDLHDELGADITEISMLATRAMSDAEGSDERRRCLTQMAEKARQMVATLEEIVWAMNPQHDSLGAMVNYFSFFADRFLRLANIKLTIDISPEAVELAVEARIRHQLFLAFKEALANVVKHSGATEVHLMVRVEERMLCVIVTDNGCGFREPVPATGQHEGIVNMRRRMEKLGGRFEISAEKGNGTMVKFLAPLNS